MAQKKPRDMGLGELMSWLGDAQPGSTGRPGLEAEYERRKFVWQRVAVVIAGVGVAVGLLGVIVAATHLSRHSPVTQKQVPAVTSN
jgi:hypothetical protein